MRIGDAGITATLNVSTFDLAERKDAFLHAYAWNKDDPELLRLLLNGRSDKVNIAAELAQQQWGAGLRVDARCLPSAGRAKTTVPPRRQSA
jgi:hypothetical protein